MKKLLIIFLYFPLFSTAQSSVIRKCIPMEYQSYYLTSSDILYAIYQSNNVVALPLPGGRTTVDAAGCFNLVRACGNDGSVWYSPQYNSLSAFSWTSIPTDSTGAAINYAMLMSGYADNYTIIGTDSLLRFGGVDDPGIFHSSGSVFMRPYKMTTGSQKFRKAIICAFGVWALSSDGMTVYNWTAGSGQTPTTYTFAGKGTGKVLDITSGNGNAFSNAVFVVIQQTAGSAYGWPYVQGAGYGLWGSGTPQSFASFTDLHTQWGLTSMVSEIVVNSMTTHFIDSLGNMYGTGFNVQGEVGNGSEFVNRYTYPSWPNYGWDFTQENPITTGVIQIGTGRKYSHIFTNGFFTFYYNALDVNDSLYVWGRNKTVVLPVGPNGTRTGLLDFADNPNNPNAQDVLVPTLAHPFTQNNLTLNWFGPVISAGSTQNITTSSTTLAMTGHPALLINSTNSSDTINYSPASYLWTKVSGPNTPTITSASSKTTTVTGLVNGTYVFNVFTIDSNTGQNSANVTVNVNIPAANPTIKITIGSRLVLTNHSP